MTDSPPPSPTLSDRLDRLSPAQRALLEQRLRQTRGKPANGAAGAVPSAVDVATAQLSFGQERLFFLWQLDPESALYNSTIYLHLDGPLDDSALQRTLDRILERHEPLRTVFRTGEALSQSLLAPVSLPVQHYDVADLPQNEREAALEAQAVKFAQEPFDLIHGPIIRAALWRCGESSHDLLVVLHHIAFDGWSRGVFVGELAECYRAIAAGEYPAIAPLRCSYAGFAAWQRGSASSERFAADLAYWQAHLDGAPDLLDLPLDRPRPAVLRGRGGSVPIVMEQDSTDRLIAFGRENSATLFTILLAGYYAVLQRWTGQDDIVVATAVAGRSRLETEDLIGFFVNTLALRATGIGRLSFEDLVVQVRDVVTSALAHQDTPFEKLIERLHVRGDRSRSPVAQVMIILRDSPERVVAAGALTLHPRDIFIGATRFDLEMQLWIANDGSLAGSLVYDTDLFDDRSARAMATGFETLLRAAAANPRAQAPDLPAIPLTPNGIRDLTRLPKPAEDPRAETAPTKASGPIEPQLLLIWQELFPGRPIGVEDDFFDLGGHSLLAVRLVWMIEEQLGLRLSMQQLFEMPTVRGVASALLSEESISPQPASRLLAGRPGATPLFFFHGDFDGVGLYCRRLARLIDPDTPFYGIAPLGSCGEELPWSVEDAAEIQWRRVRELQPQGPYLFGGFCNGAVVAYEVAHLATRAGERVEGVLLVDATSGNLDEQPILKVVKPLFALTSRSSRTRLLRLLRARNRIARLLCLKRRMNSAVDDLLAHDDLPHGRRLHHRYLWIGRTYVPPRSKCRLSVIRCRNGRPNFALDEICWRKAAANLEYTLYDGNHASLIRERLDILAGWIDRLADPSKPKPPDE